MISRDRDYICSYPPPFHPSLKQNVFKIWMKFHKEQALKIGREVAEGPTQAVYDPYWGHLELIPLVPLEDLNDFPR